MRNAAIVLMVAALAACEAETAPLTDAEERPEAVTGTLPVSELPRPKLPPPPPLWRIEPMMDPHGSMLDGVPDDPVHGIPEPLRGLRASMKGDEYLRSAVSRWPDGLRWADPPALSREDFRRGSRSCLADMVDQYRGGAADHLDLRSVEVQTHWYASMRAKEAVYGVGVEAMCERISLQHALHVARGDWPKIFDGHPDREEIFETLARLEADVGYPREDDFPANAEDAARLERWLR